MHNLPLPTINAREVFDNIKNAKEDDNKNPLENNKLDVFDAYDYYSNNAPEFSNLAAVDFENDVKTALRHTYTSSTAPLKSLKKYLKRRFLAKVCPSCGISESNSFDHYLPKEDYPEFSCLPINLVPCCIICNSFKKTRVFDKVTQKRIFFHPYYDRLPKVRFLDIQVEFLEDSVEVEFVITQHNYMTADLTERLSSHFEKLNLSERYYDNGLFSIGSILEGLVNFHKSGGASLVSEELKKTAIDYRGKRGHNNWNYLLYWALSENEEFCDGGFLTMQPK